MAGTADEGALGDLQAEMIDRFGPLPPPAQTLFGVHRIRVRAERLGIRRLVLAATGGTVEFAPGHRVDPRRVVALIEGADRRYRLDGQERLRVKIEAADRAARFAAAETLLADLGG